MDCFKKNQNCKRTIPVGPIVVVGIDVVKGTVVVVIGVVVVGCVGGVPVVVS